MPSKETGEDKVREEGRRRAGEAGAGGAEAKGGGGQVREEPKYAGGLRFLNDMVKGTVKVKNSECRAEGSEGESRGDGGE